MGAIVLSSELVDICVARASRLCSLCNLTGIYNGSEGPRPCDCVCRSVFRTCILTYHEAEFSEAGAAALDFRADLESISRRNLPEGRYPLFSSRFLRAGVPPRWASMLGEETMLGLAYLTTAPHPLFPFYRYFNDNSALEYIPAWGASRRRTVVRRDPDFTNSFS